MPVQLRKQFVYLRPRKVRPVTISRVHNLLLAWIVWHHGDVRNPKIRLGPQRQTQSERDRGSPNRTIAWRNLVSSGDLKHRVTPIWIKLATAWSLSTKSPDAQGTMTINDVLQPWAEPRNKVSATPINHWLSAEPHFVAPNLYTRYFAIFASHLRII
jgi:hypothetical protein